MALKISFRSFPHHISSQQQDQQSQTSSHFLCSFAQTSLRHYRSDLLHSSETTNTALATDHQESYADLTVSLRSNQTIHSSKKTTHFSFPTLNLYHHINRNGSRRLQLSTRPSPISFPVKKQETIPTTFSYFIKTRCKAEGTWLFGEAARMTAEGKR